MPIGKEREGNAEAQTEKRRVQARRRHVLVVPQGLPDSDVPDPVLLDVVIELKLPEIMGDVTDYIMYNAGTASFVRHDLNMLLLKMLGYTLMTLVVGYCTARFVAIASMGFGANMRSAIFNKVQDLSFDNIDRFKIGSLITRTVSDTSARICRKCSITPCPPS